MDNKTRCTWVDPNNSRYVEYHDTEWGIPLFDDQKLFEALTLEIFQSGLSFECVLNKRENFICAFDNFNIQKISAYDDKKISELMTNTGIIRNRSKISATINNAKIFTTIQKEYGTFSNYIWGFTNNKILFEQGLSSSPLSDKITKDLKCRGMKFIGTTTIYAFLQATGIINSHDEHCFLYKKNM